MSIDQTYIDRVYGQLTGMDVQLDADPIEFVSFKAEPEDF